MWVLLRTVEPEVPGTPVVRALREMTPEDRAAEVVRARRWLQASQTYLAWAEMGQQLASEFDQLAASHNGRPVVVEARAATAVTVSANSDGTLARPSLRRAVHMILSTDPEKVWKKSEIMDALKQRGWEPRGGKPSAALATRLSEMIERDEAKRVSYGHYRLTGNGDKTTQGTLLGAGTTAE